MVGMVAMGRKSRCLRPQLYYVALAATPHRVLGCEQHQQPSARRRAAEYHSCQSSATDS